MSDNGHRGEVEEVTIEGDTPLAKPDGSHFHFIVWAALEKSENNYSGVTYLDVIAENIDDALARAKRLCPKRRHYWVNNIIEHHPHTREQEQESHVHSHG